MHIENNKLCGSESSKSLMRVYCKNLKPKFQKLTLEDYQKDKTVPAISPMCAEVYNPDVGYLNYCAEFKFDGHRQLMYITPKGNRFFSRTIAKNGWYGECSDNLLQFRDWNFEGYSNNPNGITVLDGEVTMEGGFKYCQGVCGGGTLPETALDNQLKNGFATYNVFDIIYYKGICIKNFPLWLRKLYLAKFCYENKNPYIKFVKIHVCKNTFKEFSDLVSKNKNVPDKSVLAFLIKHLVVCDSFKSLLDDIWADGNEGLMLKDITASYQYKRVKHMLKWKESLTKDVVIMGFKEPSREFEGKTDLMKWKYWMGKDGKCYIEPKQALIKSAKLIPVTKPYALGYVGAIEVGVYRDKQLYKVAEILGITEKLQEHIKTHKKEMLGQVIEVKAQKIIDTETGSLRHPVFHRLRPEKVKAQCTWEAYING